MRNERFKNLLNRLGKAVIMSAEAETSEIIRRRLFEWDPRAVSQDGKVLLSQEAREACREHADWLEENRSQVPAWFPADHAASTFEATYPFHPMVLSVFERKWQALPRFQQTRGILRLLALWVSNVYRQGFKKGHRDALITLGTAPLDDTLFRSALFEQLGESRLEGAVTTDIAGKRESHAIRLDEEAVDTIRTASLHRKVATTVFFESNGGQTRNEATLPEIRLAVAGPGTDLGNVETALEALTEACYYLQTEKNRYWFSLKENLNKRFADRRANVKDQDLDGRIRAEIQKAFPATEGLERVFFPSRSSDVPDRPVVTLIVLGPDSALGDDPGARARIEAMTREHGKANRTFKSGLIWVMPEASAPLREAARKLLAWESIEEEDLSLDDTQRKQLGASVKTARRDLTECVWRTYKVLIYLGRDNTLETADLGLVTSSAADSLSKLILLRLKEKGEVEKEVGPRCLVKNWPPAFKEWSTRAVRDAFYSSPLFPRLLNAETVRDTIARGVREGQFAYVGKTPEGRYEPLVFKKAIAADDVEISEDMFILPGSEAEKAIEPPQLATIAVSPSQTELKPGENHTFTAQGFDQFGREIKAGEIRWTATGGEIGADGVFTAGKDEGAFLVKAECGPTTGTASVRVAAVATPIYERRHGEPSAPPMPRKLVWTGDVPPQKWTNLYMKVLTKLITTGEVKIHVTIEASPKDGATEHLIQETKAGLRGLGLEDRVSTG